MPARPGASDAALSTPPADQSCAIDVAPSVARLYIEHHPWLRSWLRRRLGDAGAAADLAHDTFVRVLSKQDRPRIQEPRAFLTTIAHALMLNLRRRQRVEQAYLDALAHWPHAHALSPEDTAILVETLVSIDRVLHGLPRGVRDAFLLSQLDGLRQREIAERLGISVPTVKRHIARALAACSTL